MWLWKFWESYVPPPFFRIFYFEIFESPDMPSHLKMQHCLVRDAQCRGEADSCLNGQHAWVRFKLTCRRKCTQAVIDASYLSINCPPCPLFWQEEGDGRKLKVASVAGAFWIFRSSFRKWGLTFDSFILWDALKIHFSSSLFVIRKIFKRNYCIHLICYRLITAALTNRFIDFILYSL